MQLRVTSRYSVLGVATIAVRWQSRNWTRSWADFALLLTFLSRPYRIAMEVPWPRKDAPTV